MQGNLRIRSLNQRIGFMPIAPFEAESLIGNLPTKCVEANMIIERASLGPANSMAFCVTLLGSNALPLAGYNHVWITNDAMSTIVNTSTAKKKYVYDQTVIPREGWIPRSHHALTQNQSQDEGFSL